MHKRLTCFFQSKRYPADEQIVVHTANIQKTYETTAMPNWLTALITELTSPGFTALANLFGVLAFVFTILVYFNVRQISNHYGALIRLPELRTSLLTHASKIGDFLSDFENGRDNISLEFAKLLPMLLSVKKRLGISQRHTVNALIKDVNNCRKNSNFAENQIRQVFNHLHTLVTELEQWESDIRWRK